jgi:ribosomal peptide maturation radical SAM protein 1
MHFEAVLEAREFVAPFLDACLERLNIEAYDAIGFTTSFQQTLASLSLGQRIKARFPEKIILMGGSNCEGIMGQELMQRFPWIDFVIGGEADNSLPELIRRIVEKLPLAGIPGLLYREDGTLRQGGPQDRIANMDALPYPDFIDFFSALSASRLGPRLQPAILIENARGCWWGAKSQCSFCGLNGDTLQFRAKSASRVLAEIEHQLQRHGIKNFQAVDNILSQSYFKDLLPALKDRSLGVKFFYEVKSNLRPKQVRLLKEAGIWAIQPGVESLNTHVLTLMHKGVTALQNIQLLKACRDYGVEPAWNLLYGFPGETMEDYAQTARLIPALYHLKPPGAVSPIRLDRFSPNFNQAESIGLTDIRPFAMYPYIFPFPAESVANLAYFFEYKHRDGRNPDDVLKHIQEPINTWKANRGGDLVKKNGKKPELMIIDTRPGHPHQLYPFDGILKELYDFCDEIHSYPEILAFAVARSQSAPEQVRRELDDFLAQMVDLQLMVCEAERYLSLAVRSDVEYRGLEAYQQPDPTSSAGCFA